MGNGEEWREGAELRRRPLSPPQLIDSQVTRMHAATENTHYLAKALAKEVHNFLLASQAELASSTLHARPKSDVFMHFSVSSSRIRIGSAVPPLILRGQCCSVSEMPPQNKRRKFQNRKVGFTGCRDFLRFKCVFANFFFFGLTVHPEWRPLVQLHVQHKGVGKRYVFTHCRSKSFHRNENSDESRTRLSAAARSSPFKYFLFNALPHFSDDSLFSDHTTAACTRPASADWRTA